jgi:hypothetical protein
VPIAVPTPRFVVQRLGFDWLYHYAPLAAFEGGIIRRVTGRPREWTDCEIALRSSSGFSGGRLFRDYSVVDLEVRISGRASTPTSSAVSRAPGG